MSETEEDVQLQEEKLTLQTRAKTYEKLYHRPLASPSTSTNTKSSKKSDRHNLIKCKIHDGKRDTWLPENTTCNLCLKVSQLNMFKSGTLPCTEDVLNVLLSMKAKGRSINSELEVAYMLCYTWISCNVYPTSVPTVQRKIADLYEDYRGIKKYVSKSESYWSKCIPFLKSMTELFDVVASMER